MYVLSPDRELRRWALLLRAILFVVLSSVIMRVAFRHDRFLPRQWGNVDLVVTLTIVMATGAVPTFMLYRRIRGWSCVWFSLTYLILINLSDVLLAFFYVGMEVRSGWYTILTGVGATDPTFVLTFPLTACSGAGLAIGWIVQRIRHGAIVAQDGTLCPSCGYSIRGNTDFVCPECGKEFRPEELGPVRVALASNEAGRHAD